MTDAGGEPAEDETPAHRYWFPKALAKFYIPLPDPLPIRDGYTHIWSFPIWPWQIEEKEAGGAVEVGDRWLQRVASQASAFLTVEEQHEAPAGEPTRMVPRLDPSRPHAGLSAFGSAVRLWMGTAHGIPFPSLKHMADTTRRAEALNEGVTVLSDDELSTHLAQDIDYTVAEVVVPLLSEPDDQDEEDAGTRAFNYAISTIQNMQEAIYQIRRYPLREVTKELCPPFVPFLTGVVTSADTPHDFPVERWVKHGMMLHMNPWDYGRPAMLTDEEYQHLDEALWTRLKDRPFTSSLELRRSATVALERTGDYRSSVIWSAAQAEAIFDELLRHLMWEEGRLPERCLQEFQTLSISSRVKTHYEHRLGGTWDLTTSGAITDWKVKVADLRNRIVHEHYRPTWTQAHDAIAAVDALISHVGDLLAQKLKRYFRTAMQLIGNPGLLKRGVFDEFHEHAEKAYPLDWTFTYGQWRSTHKLLLGEPRTLDVSRTTLYFVHGRRNSGYWLVVDDRTELAARALVDEDTIDPLVMANIIRLLDGPQEINPERALSMRMAVEPNVVKLIDKPREKYHLLPMYGVRVNGGDIADKEFTWRPRPARTASVDART